MKLINKKNFFPTVCTVFTVLMIGKVLLEAVFQGVFGGYQENVLMMFFFSLLGTFVLSQHYRFQNLPLLAVIGVQYLLLVSVVLGVTWLGSFVEPIHEEGYRDMFLSFSIPYGIAAIVYYISLFYEVRRANRILDEVRRKENERI